MENLSDILRNLQPFENPGTYVFVSVPASEKTKIQKIDDAGKIMQFMEIEGSNTVYLILVFG